MRNTRNKDKNKKNAFHSISYGLTVQCVRACVVSLSIVISISDMGRQVTQSRTVYHNYDTRVNVCQFGFPTLCKTLSLSISLALFRLLRFFLGLNFSTKSLDYLFSLMGNKIVIYIYINSISRKATKFPVEF